MRAAIVLDRWKLEIFKKHLEDGGFEYEVNNGLAPDELLIFVETEDLEQLKSSLRAAYNEVVKKRMH